MQFHQLKIDIDFYGGVRYMDLKEILTKAIEYSIETNYIEYEKTVQRNERINNAKCVACFGAGKFLEDAFPYIKDAFSIDCVVDNDRNKWGDWKYGLKCYPLDVVKNDIDIVIVTVGKPDEIEKKLNSMGIEYYLLNDLIKNMYTSKHSKEWFMSEQENIIKGIDIFEDNLSKEVYVKAICDRLHPNICETPYWRYQTQNEYFDMSFWKLSSSEGYLDIGAYTGDTIEKFLDVTGGCRFFYAYELDEKIFNELQVNIRDKLVNDSKAFNVGISDATSEDGQFIKLDDVEYPDKVSFIKMDIEGFEENALRGGKKIIKKYKPKMAICCYHKLEHIWRLPLMVKEINAKYKLYMRHHSPCAWDTVCYAV